MAPDRPKKLVLFCDGTWCGRETGTQTNIWLLAKCIGIDMENDKFDLKDTSRGVTARYFEGCGLGKPFLYYLFNGATGSDIGGECIESYKYIVENYTPEHEIWMFGLSRGAYTVRCVAGMINNCGILRRQATASATAALCEEIYQFYRSPCEEDSPGSRKMISFREKASWPVQTPIKFMGLLDTVGSLGIPRLNPGVTEGGDWPEFHNQNISGEVEKVYHAMSLHDRLWMFQPCRALRDAKHASNSNFDIHEMWFPGCHYDLGRQKFKFLPSGDGPGISVVEKALFDIPNRMTKAVEPNPILADLVLRWMLKAINTEGGGTLVPDISGEISNLENNMRTFYPNSYNQGSGDVYWRISDHVPGADGTLGHLAGWLSSRAADVVDWVTPGISLGTAIRDALGLKSLQDILLAVRDRMVPYGSSTVAQLQNYKELDPELLVTIKDKAGIDAERYPSRTYESYQEYLHVIGDIDASTYRRRVG